MNHTSLLNYLIAKIGARSYLEIGVRDDANFDKIACGNRTGVDIVDVKLNSKNYKFYKMSSDEFFLTTDQNIKYDIIFIDGLHREEQVKRDILNATTRLSENGFIVCHDINPLQEEHQSDIPPPSHLGLHWNGSAWKAFVGLRASLLDWNFLTVNIDEGCGIIWRGKENSFTNNLPLTWENLQQNRARWLNLIQPEDFMNAFFPADIRLKVLLNAYLGDPGYEYNNFKLGLLYEEIGQKASAVSFYIRAAERAWYDKNIQYESLIRAALCFIAQGTRGLSVRGLLQRAIALLPKRPEAYFLLSRWWEREASIEGWVNSYTLACMGLEIADFSSPQMRTWVEYPGKYGLMFERAVAGWWVGQCEESRNIFLDLLKNYQLDESHRQSIINNLKFMEGLTGKKLVPIA